MILTNENYYSREANLYYMSVSQFKAFECCEAAAMAELHGNYIQPKTKALLIGSYVDAWFEGTVASFKKANPEIFKRNGTLKSDFAQADRIIARVQQDKTFMEYMSGEKQRIFTADLFGTPWKIKVDSWFLDKLVDLKIMRTLEPIMGKSFIEYWGYDTQGAVYQAVEGGHKRFYIAAATKERPTDFDVIHVPQYALDESIDYVERRIPHILAVKRGEIQPERCGVCQYCRLTKVLSGPIEMEDAGYSMKQLRAMKGEY